MGVHHGPMGRPSLQTLCMYENRAFSPAIKPETFPPCKIIPVDGTVVQQVVMVKSVLINGMTTLNSLRCQCERVSDALPLIHSQRSPDGPQIHHSPD